MPSDFGNPLANENHKPTTNVPLRSRVILFIVKTALESIPITIWSCSVYLRGPQQDLMRKEARLSQPKASETTPGKVAKKQRLGAPEPSGAEQQVPPEPKKLFQAGEKAVLLKYAFLQLTVQVAGNMQTLTHHKFQGNMSTGIFLIMFVSE